MNLSNTFKLKRYDLNVSKNNPYWYKTVLRLDSEHPEANYWCGCELEQKGNYLEALKYYQTAYNGGFNSAILGINRTQKLISPKTDIIPKKSNNKRWLLLLFLCGLLFFILYYVFQPFSTREQYKIYNIIEKENNITEQDVYLHSIPTTPTFKASDFNGLNLIPVVITKESTVKDVIIYGEEFVKNNRLSNKASQVEFIFYYGETPNAAPPSLTNPVAKAVWHKSYGGIKDIHLYPGFLKKNLS